MPYLRRNAPRPEPIDCRILTAALELFVSRGYHNVSVHDVQRRAGVSIGSIYNHFGGKEGIAKALYGHLLNELSELVKEVMESHKSLGERSRTLIRLLFEFTETRRDIIAFVFHAKHREFLPDEPPICSAEPFRRMRDMVEEGMARGEIGQGNAWVATATLFGGAIRLIQLRLDGVLEEPLPELAEEAWESVWNGLGAGEEVVPLAGRSAARG
ncbi:MAG TPA: TetR/AcrR family transcriptional regulator [Thiolapillus brandeum]|uniref:TetR/AcrR family transcriptional regulator n=1 Tax=Thiolapillus brandeum TaxID=1076588 RepID=A0A7C5MZ66_9GAMM|nr:TetR/AcrR family transcriptional regulator [Thiolapillus brandeum]